MNESTAQRGKIMLVGLGPGSPEHMTARARAAIAEADTVIGYATYIKLVADLLEGKEVIKKGMTEELDRAVEALERAGRGRRVALVSSGDAGVYGMAGPTFEVLFQAGWNPASGIEVEIVPGASALNSCAALVGAPLTHDFCAISLSDLLTPWPVIARRLDAAAAADFVVALYNPKSGRRTGQILEAQRLFLAHRRPDTPVAVVKSAYRAKQRLEFTTLDRMADCDIGMLSTVLIGNSQTFVRNGLMVTPRGYGNKYEVSSGETLDGERAGRSLSAGLDGWLAEVRSSGESAEALARRHALPLAYVCEVLGERWPGPVAETFCPGTGPSLPHPAPGATFSQGEKGSGHGFLGRAGKSPHRYETAEIDGLWRAMRERRDMRHFLPDPLPEGTIEHLVEAAHIAPSVGFMQPWRFLRIKDADLRRRIHGLVEEERLRTAEVLPSRNAEFRRVKIEGILDCAEVLVCALMPGREAHIVGRRTLPQMDIASVGCAIQNMWLAARAEGIGLGWVSFFDPQALAGLLGMPEGAEPVAILCIGRVAAFYPRPMFEDAGWGQRLPLDQILFDDRWPAGAGGTPTAY
ncbi:MAG: precorrin-3B C(17)-methyltransferase [Gammaproteobacteria bacterium]|nr:precorrin-3B C(17)-methyltransferase [Gammaproteobacteria bacterium]MBU1656149.1 precorrin-3B C(17)-methyltransferase [Gammaproteobacteria bacterium]MBU1960793.1 precorrin-3B C(17)-methyltransferase [Gammaproteobacteria bacterium]